MEQAAQASAVMTKMLMMARGALSKAFYQRYGKEALQIIAEVSRRGGVATGKVMQEAAPVKSMKDVSERFKMIVAMLRGEMEIIELSDDVFHFKSQSPCSMGLEGTSKELCEALMTADQNIVSTLLGQEVDMKIPKSIAAGDKECEVIFSKK